MIRVASLLRRTAFPGVKLCSQRWRHYEDLKRKKVKLKQRLNQQILSIYLKNELTHKSKRYNNILSLFRNYQEEHLMSTSFIMELGITSHTKYEYNYLRCLDERI